MAAAAAASSHRAGLSLAVAGPPSLPSSGLTALHLADCGIGDSGAAALGDAIAAGGSSLVALELESNEITAPAACASLGRAARNASRLRWLGLANNRLADDGLREAMKCGLLHGAFCCACSAAARASAPAPSEEQRDT